MCRPKEPNFFCHDENYARGWEWYERFFREHEGAGAVGDVSPVYSHTSLYPETPARIARDLPEARLVYVVRHPLRRIQSAYLQGLHTNQPMPREFRRAVREYGRLLEGSLYWKCISDYLQHFPREQLTLLFFEDFRADPGLFMERLFRLIGVDGRTPMVEPGRPRNATADHDMDSTLLRLLRHAPGLGLLGKTLPAGLARRLRSALRVKVPTTVPWDPETKDWVLRRVADDAGKTLSFAGKPPDFWDLEAV